VPEALSRAALLERGHTAADLERLLRDGSLTRLRRGAYAWPDGDLSPEASHVLLLAATWAQLRAPATVSHVSAAVLHQLPVWTDHLARVHLTRPRTGGGKDGNLLRVHTSALPPDQVVVLGGMSTTSSARTVADLGRTLPLEQAVAAADTAARAGLGEEALSAVLAGCAGWPGIARALLVARLMDGRSESAGESVSRVRMHQAGLPTPVPQFVVHDDRGQFIARCDFGWPDHGVVGEFDGRSKYGRLLRPGQDVTDVVYREKLREDALRDLDLRMVRWTWPDLYPGDVLADRLRRVLYRG
jgi:hypothetical protein